MKNTGEFTITVFSQRDVLLTGVGTFLLAVVLMPHSSVIFGMVWAHIATAAAWSMRTARVAGEGDSDGDARNAVGTRRAYRVGLWGSIAIGFPIGAVVSLLG